ncbi:MAG: hypothetical protein HY747_00970 [Elusimicrobia bacterium]|nr:hypothetical protein [Elusimicrobiota bacterium]
MRKIKNPKITVKPREVFYQLKRGQKLGSLDEDMIEEILNNSKPLALVDPACVYENISCSEFLVPGLDFALNASALSAKSRPGTISCAAASLGDHGFEAALNSLGGGSMETSRHVVMAWGEVFLNKLCCFADNLIEKEAAEESLELGLSQALDIGRDKALIEFLWQRLKPEEKIGVQLKTDPLDGSLKFWPVLSKIWLVPWLTKKEKQGVRSQISSFLQKTNGNGVRSQISSFLQKT